MYLLYIVCNVHRMQQLYTVIPVNEPHPVTERGFRTAEYGPVPDRFLSLMPSVHCSLTYPIKIV